MEGRMRRISIKTIQGQIREFDISPTIEIRELKQIISEHFGIQPQNQRLIYKAKLVKDEHRLNDYINEDGQTIQLLNRGSTPAVLRGPGQPQRPAGPNVHAHQQRGNAGPPRNPPINIFGQQAQPQQPQRQHQHHHHAGMPPVPAQPAPPPNLQPSNAQLGINGAHLDELEQTLNRMSGPGTQLPTTEGAGLNVEPNALVEFGGFMRAFGFQLTRLTPMISRLGDLLQRESLITDSSHRQNVAGMAGQLSYALEAMTRASQQAREPASSLTMGYVPGSYQMCYQNQWVLGAPNAQPQQPAPQQPQQPPPQPPVAARPQPQAAAPPQPQVSAPTEESKIDQRFLLRQINLGRQMSAAFADANIPLPMLEIPQDLHEQYRVLFREQIQQRLQTDPDFAGNQESFPNIDSYFNS